MERAINLLRITTAVALLTGAAFLVAPVNTEVEPFETPASDSLVTTPVAARSQADSLAEDIILHNIFSPTRAAPSRRYTSASPDEAGMASDPSPDPSLSSGFSPELIGTAISDRPGETKALLRLLANDPTPRLYAVGDRAGGYSVVSIDPRSVVLNGPRGRVVLRLPQDEESHS